VGTEILFFNLNSKKIFTKTTGTKTQGERIKGPSTAGVKMTLK